MVDTAVRTAVDAESDREPARPRCSCRLRREKRLAGNEYCGAIGNKSPVRALDRCSGGVGRPQDDRESKLMLFEGIAVSRSLLSAAATDGMKVVQNEATGIWHLVGARGCGAEPEGETVEDSWVVVRDTVVRDDGEQCGNCNWPSL